MANTFLSNASAEAAVEAIYTSATNWYQSLHTASPGQSGANEVTGGSYGRLVIQFTGSSGNMASTDAQSYTLMPSVTITHFGIWSTVTSGTYKGGGALTSSLVVPSGATVAFAIGATTVAVNG